MAHRLKVVWNQNNKNDVRDRKRDMEVMFTSAQSIFIDGMGGGGMGGGGGHVVVQGTNPLRASKVAIFTFPMSINVFYGSTAQLGGAAADSEDKVGAAERWGDAVGEGLLDIAAQVDTPQAALARVAIGTLATHARLLTASARDQELSTGNSKVLPAYKNRVGKGDFTELQHWLDELRLDGGALFMQQLHDFLQQKEGAVDFIQLMDNPCAPTISQLFTLLIQRLCTMLLSDAHTASGGTGSRF